MKNQQFVSWPFYLYLFIKLKWMNYVYESKTYFWCFFTFFSLILLLFAVLKLFDRMACNTEWGICLCKIITEKLSSKNMRTNIHQQHWFFSSQIKTIDNSNVFHCICSSWHIIIFFCQWNDCCYPFSICFLVFFISKQIFKFKSY